MSTFESQSKTVKTSNADMMCVHNTTKENTRDWTENHNIMSQYYDTFHMLSKGHKVKCTDLHVYTKHAVIIEYIYSWCCVNDYKFTSGVFVYSVNRDWPLNELLSDWAIPIILLLEEVK